MCFLQLEDKFSTLEIVVFPDVYGACSHLLSEKSVIHVRGKIALRDDRPPQITADFIESGERMSENALKKNLCVKVNSHDEKMLGKIRQLCEKHKGNSVQLNIFFEDLKKLTVFKNHQTINLTVEALKDFQYECGVNNCAFMERKR